MKKKVILTIGAMTIAAVIGLVFSQQLFASADPDLTTEDVRAQVEAQYPGEIVEIELKNEGQDPVYEIELAMDGQKYELRIDANSGKVIKLTEKFTASKIEESSFEIREKENTKEQESKEKTEDSPKQAQNKEEAPNHSETKENANADKKSTMISREKAIEIAQAQFSGEIDGIELEEDDGKVFYEIEIESSKGEAEIEIDAFTGKVLMVDIDLEDD